jgi:hypothetical protein
MIRTGTPLSCRNIHCAICGGTTWRSDNYKYLDNVLVHITCYNGAMRTVGAVLQKDIDALKDQIARLNELIKTAY